MKRITKIFSLIFAIVFIISIFPAVKIDAAEKKYKLSLTGEYDLDDDDKVIYNYSKMLKNIKLEKVEGKNQWNLTMYAGTTVVLPYTADAATAEVKITTASEYVSGNALYSDTGGWIKVTAREKYKQTKTVANKVLTCKAYNESGKCLSTLKIVVKILPYSVKMERTKLITVEELYKLGYHRDSYSDFAWEQVVGKHKEVLLEGSYDPLYVLADHVTELATYEKKAPQYLYDEFGGKDIEELLDNIYEKESDEFWGYDYDLIWAAEHATSWGTSHRPGQDVFDQLDSIFSELNLEQYTTDWEKVLAFQKWVKANIEYEEVKNVSVRETLKRGYTMCEGYANLMCAACQKLNVPCYVVDDPKGGTFGRGHAWNIVLVDGMWCTMDLTGDPSFGWVADKKNYKYTPTISAFEELVKVFGGTTAKDKGLIWSCVTDNWDQRD